MIVEILSSSLAALAALGPVAQGVAASALVVDFAALAAIRGFLGNARPAAPGVKEPDWREAA